MKTLLALVCILAAGTSPLLAQEAGKFGAGVVIGAPTGATAKYWVDGSRALDFGLGLNDNVTVYGDYLWHSWNVFPQPASGKVPAYLGLGAQVGDSDRHNHSGLRAVAGVAYWLPRNPLEIFFEIVPTFHFSHDEGTDVNMAIGLRYYFR